MITILLFFAIPDEMSIGSEFQGVLLFVILVSCLIMTLSLIAHKNKLTSIGLSEGDAFLEVDGDGGISKEENPENI